MPSTARQGFLQLQPFFRRCLCNKIRDPAVERRFATLASYARIDNPLPPKNLDRAYADRMQIGCYAEECSPRQEATIVIRRKLRDKIPSAVRGAVAGLAFARRSHCSVDRFLLEFEVDPMGMSILANPDSEGIEQAMLKRRPS